MDGKEYGEIHVGMQAGRYSYTYRPKSPNVQHSHRCHTERQTVGQTDGRRHIGKDRDRDNDKDRGKDRDKESDVAAMQYSLSGCPQNTPLTQNTE